MQTSKLKSLSVFFPCFNEEKNINFFVEEALATLPKIADKYEIIIVDDGSSDDTGKVADILAKKNNHIRAIHHKKNMGYGEALKSGFANSKYDWIFFTDGDLQFKISQLSKFVHYSDKYEVIIGYRKKRAEGFMRVVNAKLFKIYIDILFRLHVKDIDCAFKLFKADVIKKIELQSSGAFTSAELLYKLKKRHIAFKQIAVDHQERIYGNPTGNNPRVAIKAGLEALRLYLSIKFSFFRFYSK